MRRKDFYEALKLAQPALATKDLIPVFSCYFFDGKTVTACNDAVAVNTPCDLPLAGGVLGKVLFDWLGASKAKTVQGSVRAKTKDALFKAGRSKLVLGVTPSSDFNFSFPKKRGIKLVIPKGFIEAVKRSGQFMGRDPSHPWCLGVALRLEKAKLTFWTCDNFTASRSRVGVVDLPKKAEGLEVALSPQFVDLVNALARKLKLTSFELSSDWVEAQFSGGTRVWSKLLKTTATEQFKKVFSDITKKKKAESIPVPGGFEDSLERVSVVLSSAVDKHAELSVENGKLNLLAHSPIGEVKESLSVEQHPDFKEVFLPEMLLRGVADAKTLSMIPGSCILLQAKNFVYAVSIVRQDSE